METTPYAGLLGMVLIGILVLFGGIMGRSIVMSVIGAGMVVFFLWVQILALIDHDD